MAQFQILYPHSDAEWRPITIDTNLAPTGDQQYLWPSFEEAEAARQRLLIRSPDIALRVALAGSNTDDVDWQIREKLRFSDGTYSPTPWHDESWYQARHDEHFCHVSTEQAGKIAFTENDARGRGDRQLVMSPGRYLNRFFSETLDNEAIEGWCARLSVQLQEDALKITQDADEIEDVYVGGPGSCMSHDAGTFDSFCHPTRVYAGPDTALAYIGSRDDAKGRSIVWPDRKVYTSIYGDVSRLRLLLENAGYREGSLNGARIRRIEDDDSFVVPYIDAGDDLSDDGEFLIVGGGSITSESTNGLGRLSWYCPRCDEDASPHDEVWYSSGISEEWCYSCFRNHTTFCDHNERSYSDTETFITVYEYGSTHDVLEDDVENFGAVYLENRCEWWIGSLCRRCDASGDWFHVDDLVEYHGEWLSEDYLPEPFDDEDASQHNAHVLAHRQFIEEMAAIRAEIALWEASGEQARAGRLSRDEIEAEQARLDAGMHERPEPSEPGHLADDRSDARPPQVRLSAIAVAAPPAATSYAGA